MRCLGEIGGRQQAERLVAHLLTKEVSTHIESSGPGSDRWEIWVREEDRLELASAELEAFRLDPDHPRYANVIEDAKRILLEQKQKNAEAAKNIQQVEMVVRPGMTRGGRMPPLTLTLLILCIGLGLVNGFGSPGENNPWGRAISQHLSFVYLPTFIETGDPLADIRTGQVWRIITPIFLHGSPLHLAMNMFGLVIFGRLLERLMGTPRFAVLILALAILPNLLQGLMPASLGGNPLFVGISGVVYGFVGYVWIRDRLNPHFGISIPMPFIVIMVGMIVVGLSGAVPNWQYADLCHLGGLLVGSLAGYASESRR